MTKKAKPAAVDPLAGRHWADPPPAPAAAASSAALLHRQIRPDPANPRKDFDPEGLKELEASIVRDGLVENLVVRPLHGETTPDGLPVYMLIAGERRWQAIGSAIAHKDWLADEPIDCSIKDVDEPTARRLALVENLQRRDLKPVEEARALEALIELTGTTAAEIGRQLGFSERWAQQRMSLLKLPEKMQDRVEAGELNVEDARKAVTLLPQLSAIKTAELVAGKLSVADAKRWIDGQPKALDRKPGEWLIVLEILDAIARAGKDATKVICRQPDAREIDRVHGYPHYLVAVYAQNQDGYATGLAEASMSYNASQQLRLRFGQEGLDKREKPRWDLILQLRREAGIKEPELSRPPGTYATEWLNGPFEVDPEIAAKIAGAKAERHAEQERRAAADAAAKQRIGEAFNQVQSIEAKVRKAPPAALDARLIESLAAFGIVLPVHVAKDGSVNDASGQSVVHCGYHPSNVPLSLLAKNRLIALALNSAAGLATPEKPPSEVDEDVLPRAEFVRVLADLLLEDCDDLPEDESIALFEATLRAGRGLDAFLAQEAIEYGDAEYDWDETGAMALAQGIRVDGLGAQVDLEQAIAEAAGPEPEAPAAEAPAEGDEFSPALLALAGGRPREVAA